MTGESRARFQIHATPRLEAPVLVVALEGWVDAGLGAANAVAALTDDDSSLLLVTFDNDHFVDQRARRPIVRIVDGITTELTWPCIQIRHDHDDDGADVLYLTGPEPDYHWRDLVDDVVDLARSYGARMVVGLGAFPAPAPHTRPVRLAATAPAASAALLARVGIVPGELTVPAGFTSALELALGNVDVPVVTLWARVPHYVAAMPFPAASAALVEGLASVTGLAFDSSSLRADADRARRRVDELVAPNRDHLTMVRKLEEAIDASEGNALGLESLPSEDELAAELERFLRGEDH
ncbi:MAG: PAC2 family protein [Acidimicrobiales bacterium]